MCFGCGKSEEEERKDAQMGRELAQGTMMIAGAPIMMQRTFLYINSGHITDSSIKEVEDMIDSAKKCHKALDVSPKSMKYLEGWKDFRSEAKDVVDDAIDLLKDFKDIVEKARKKKNINGDIEDYNDDIKKYEKRYRKLEELHRKL